MTNSVDKAAAAAGTTTNRTGSDALEQLANQAKAWGQALGFQAVGISDLDVAADAGHLRAWLAANHHGSMEWMATHADLRADPKKLHPGTLRVITARMNYLPESQAEAQAALDDPNRAYISRYALGRDYHKLMRKRLKTLGQQISDAALALDWKPDQRPFVDSAPVLEKALARNGRLGWIGKHTLLLDRSVGSYFFIGELLTNLPLPVDDAPPVKDLCGTCTACIDICPTQAIIAPQKLDARRCISYLTIESNDAIPEALRPAIGNRIFGCDDCQLVCPWNRYAQHTAEPDFAPRHGLDTATLLELWAWDEPTFLKRTEGMAIRRTGWRGWQRNLAVALGNAPRSDTVAAALTAALDTADTLVREHIQWALKQHDATRNT